MGRFRPHQRLHRRAEFQRVYEGGARTHGRYMTLTVAPNALLYSRLGVAATRRLGGAVSRNRAKRLIREVFRRNNPVPGFDVVVTPKRELLDATLVALETEFRQILDRRRLRARPDPRI